MVVLYDLERDNSGGDIEVINGYFVHFLAPEGLKKGNKRVVFVLDKSGSMSGQKIKQLKDAMDTILSDLDSEDRFNIVMFSDDVTVWKFGEALKANVENIKHAKTFVNAQQASGNTNLNDAILKSIEMLNSVDSSNALTSMIVFLTDGLPTAGETNHDTILYNVSKSNVKKYPIFSLAFGDDADYSLLKKISIRNQGMARKIYEDSDAVLQLTGFYDEIRSPVLTEIKVTYLNEAVDLSSLVIHEAATNYYDSGEIVVVGKLKNDVANKNVNVDSLQAKINARSVSGPISMSSKASNWHCPLYDKMGTGIQPAFGRCCPMPADSSAVSVVDTRFPAQPCCYPDCCWGWYDTCQPKPVVTVLPTNTAGGFIERMWAYQTIKKYLKHAELNEVPDDMSNSIASVTNLRQNALQLSLKYQFVTELTSMVVTEPSQDVQRLVQEKHLQKSTQGAHSGGKKGKHSRGSGHAIGSSGSSLPHGTSETANGATTSDKDDKNQSPDKTDSQHKNRNKGKTGGNKGNSNRHHNRIPVRPNPKPQPNQSAGYLESKFLLEPFVSYNNLHMLETDRSQTLKEKIDRSISNVSSLQERNCPSSNFYPIDNSLFTPHFYKIVEYSGCNINVIFVMDSTGGNENANLAKQIIDVLSSRFSQTTRMATVVVGSNVNGQSTLVQPMVPLSTSANLLKDSVHKTPQTFESELSTLATKAYGSSTATITGQIIVFFVGSQSFQYASRAFNDLQKQYPSLKVYAISTGGQQELKSLQTITGSASNCFVSPEAADIVDVLKC